jgi:hypothetical protein
VPDFSELDVHPEVSFRRFELANQAGRTQIDLDLRQSFE